MTELILVVHSVLEQDSDISSVDAAGEEIDVSVKSHVRVACGCHMAYVEQWRHYYWS